MNKILLIIKREYLTRVRKRTFIISTILFPLLYAGLIYGVGYIGEKAQHNLKIALVDSSGYFDKGRIERSNSKDGSVLFFLEKKDPAELKKNLSTSDYNGVIAIPKDVNWEKGIKNIVLQSEKTMSNSAVAPVTDKLNDIWDDIKNEKLGINDSTKSIIDESRVQLKAQNINDEKANSNVASVIGYVAGFLIYFILIIYGTQVMMGVMEEKTNRIAEVIVSSVKPFQLMLGKIVGIGLVALTQFFLWVAFVFIIYNVSKASGIATGTMGGMVGGIQQAFTSINVPLILFFFTFYFLGGFLFYSSLYAAIGSAVNEDMREAQSLGFPITLLVIFSIAILSVAMKDPTGPVAVWASIIPFSSPIIMMARIPFGVPGTVPYWQLGLSMFFLVAGFVFTTWFAGKIYRTGILMYGKKPSWKEMIKWAFRKN